MQSANTHFLLLFALLSSTSLTLTIPQAASLAVVNLGNNTVNGDLHCYPNNPYGYPRPRAQDCFAAVRRLPSSHIHGTFHESSEGDARFRLPVLKTAGPCQVLVGLRDSRLESGTWLGLNLAATQLTAACTNPEGFLPRKGGWTDAGDNDRIRISVRYSERVLEFKTTTDKKLV